MVARPPLDRFTERWTEDENGCWVWQGALSWGYAVFHVGGHGKWMVGHRWAYMHFVGPIPEGLTLDHLCRNRACVNPAHLEPVTRGENVLRGISGPAINARKTRCLQGHPYDVVWTNGARVCRTCFNTYKREYYHKHREAILAYQRIYHARNREAILAKQRKKRREQPATS